MRTATAIFACAATLSTAALAQTASSAGTSPGSHVDYDVFGVRPDGSQYSGSLKITPLEGDFYRFGWAVGTTYSGIGRQIADGEFVTLWSPDGVHCSLRALRLTETGMAGQWLSSARAGLGEEELSAPEGAGEGVVGDYVLRGTSPDGSAYEGTLAVGEAAEGANRFTWQIDGHSYTGVGVLSDGSVGLLVSDQVGSCGLSRFAADGFGNLAASWSTNAADAGNGFEWAYRQGTDFEFGGERYYPTWASPDGNLTEYHRPGEPVESWTQMVQVNRTGMASPYQFIATYLVQQQEILGQIPLFYALGPDGTIRDASPPQQDAEEIIFPLTLDAPDGSLSEFILFRVVAAADGTALVISFHVRTAYQAAVPGGALGWIQEIAQIPFSRWFP